VPVVQTEAGLRRCRDAALTLENLLEMQGLRLEEQVARDIRKRCSELLASLPVGDVQMYRQRVEP